jgi:hypothetical protein
LLKINTLPGWSVAWEKFQWSGVHGLRLRLRMAENSMRPVRLFERRYLVVG